MIEANKKSEFDFFRYVQNEKNASANYDEKKAAIRKKFKRAVAKFFRRVKKI